MRILKDGVIGILDGGTGSFTHHDPLEDTERNVTVGVYLYIVHSFTHHDPLEDTERWVRGRTPTATPRVSPITIRLRILKAGGAGTARRGPGRFTHHDPLEDTERSFTFNARRVQWRLVSPITIRLRILKATNEPTLVERCLGFTHHDPLEDTERSCQIAVRPWSSACFTHHDPLEDTERLVRWPFNFPDGAVSPITIRLRILKGNGKVGQGGRHTGFTHHDPLEDTEREME